MKKQERLNLIDELVVADKLSVDEIIKKVSEEAGVKPETVKSDLMAEYPQLFEPEFDSSEYEVPKGEEDYIHARVRLKGFDANTSKPLHRANIVKYDPRGWLQFLRKPNGYEILNILHAPENTILKADDLPEAKRLKAKENERIEKVLAAIQSGQVKI